MKVLFSPVGTADPLTQLGDGPMLHIVRSCKPDMVVLFLSPAMATLQDCDQRYTRAIELLCHAAGQALPEVTLARSAREDASQFDGYIEEFENELDAIIGNYRGCRIVANVSSGTPAMEQALVAIGAFGEYPLSLVQVPTPRGGANKREDRERPDDFDLETLWAINPDNEEGVGLRAREVHVPNFKDRILRKNVVALINGYDYEAALALAKQATGISPDATRLIEAAGNRLNLDTRVKDDSRALVSNYLWSLEVRMKQGRWADYVRALTPAYTFTAQNVLDPVLPRSSYLEKPDEDIVDKEKVHSDEKLEEVLGDACRKSRKPLHLTNWMLNDLTEAYVDDENVKQKLRTIRNFEEGRQDNPWESNRNALAHTITKARKEDIERRGGATFEQVTALLFALNGIQSGKFDVLNKQIVGLL